MSNKTTDSDHTVMYEPDFSLKKTIGVDVPLEKIFTPEKIAAGNKVIEDSRKDFFSAAEKEIEKLLELSNTPPAEAAKALPKVAAIAASLKGEGEMFGYPLIQKICSQIMETCRDESKISTKLALIYNLTQALIFTVKNKVMDDGGEAGKELLADVSRFLSTHKADRNPKAGPHETGKKN